MTPKPPIPIAIGRGCKDVESENCFNHRNFIVPLLSPHLGVWGSEVKCIIKSYSLLRLKNWQFIEPFFCISPQTP